MSQQPGPTTPTTQNPPAAPATKEERNITDFVLARVNAFKEAGELVLPKDYSPENAIKSAYLILADMTIKQNNQDVPVLTGCSKESIANSLLKMVTEGLSVAKRQGAFIAYAGKLSWQREYAGNIALSRRVAHLKDIKANVIYEGDVFKFEINKTTGRRTLLEHTQTLDSVGKAVIKGAYAITILEDGTTDLEVMTFEQIKNSWNMGTSKGQSPAHKNFPDQMACKTVINRATKILINASDDSHLFGDLENDDAPATPVTKKEGANSSPLSMSKFEDADVVTDPPPGSAEVKTENPEQGGGDGNNSGSAEQNPI